MQVRTRWARTRWALPTAVLVALSAALAGCSSAGAGAATSTSGPASATTPVAGSSAPAEPTKPDLKIIGGSSVFLPLWVAEQQGFLTDQGLTMEFEQILQGPTVVETLSSNRADAATITWVSAIYAAAAAPGPKLVMSTGLGFPVSLVLKPEIAAEYGISATSPFTDLSKLKGSHIKVSTDKVGGALYSWMTAVAQDAGLTAGPSPDNDIVLIPGDVGPAQIALWNQDQVDALFTPDEFVAASDLSEHVSVPLGRTAPMFEGIGGGAIAASEELLTEHPETVQALVNAAYQGINWAADPANKAALIELMQSKLNMPEAGAATFYDTYQASLAKGADICMTQAQFDGALALANAGAPQPISVPMSDVVDSSFCTAAAEQGT